MLEKLKKIKVNFALLAFSAYVVKMMVFQPDYPDSMIIAILAGLYGYSLKLKMFQPKEADVKLKSDVQEIKNALSKVNLSKITEPKKYF